MAHAGWITITQDPWVLDTVQGYKLPLTMRPPETVIPLMHFSNNADTLKQGGDLPSHKHRGLCEQYIHGTQEQWKDKAYILNLKSLNSYVEYKHFRMEDVCFIKDLLNKNEFTGLKDAYLTMPVHPTHQEFLRFQ